MTKKYNAHLAGLSTWNPIEQAASMRQRGATCREIDSPPSSNFFTYIMKWLLNVAHRSRNADIGFETPRCRKVSEDQLSGIKIMRMEIGHHLDPPC
jgi:hypothetical protein